jgi:replicative DNA helicase
LVAAAKSLQVTLVMLCQLNRKIEERKKFIPIMSDLRGSGQIEQDADVIVFLVWPHFIDRKLPANEYFMYVSKNRNRERTQSVAKCRFEPSRQRIVEYRMPTREVAWSDADGERKDLF